MSEMGIFWYISITNNVESCKKINEKAQTANFSDFTMGRLKVPAENSSIGTFCDALAFCASWEGTNPKNPNRNLAA